MHIVLDITQSPDGRLVGTAGRRPGRPVLPFSGRLELLARVEQLCGGGADRGPDRTGDTASNTRSRPSDDDD